MATNDSEVHWDALARLVRERRLELGIMSQKDAADQAGIHVNTWNKIENGAAVKLGSLQHVAQVLRWHPSYVTAILREGVDAPKHVLVEGSVSVVARPETVRGKARIPQPAPAVVVSAPAAPTSTPTVVAAPAGVVHAALPSLHAHVEGSVEEALPVTASKTARVGQAVDDSRDDHVVIVQVRVSRADFAELGDADLALIARVAGNTGGEVAHALAEEKRRGRQ